MRELKNRKIETNILKEVQSSAKDRSYTSRQSKEFKIIKFTGNMKENTDTLLQGIQCTCGIKRDYSHIIHAYGDKITKLRQERNLFKQYYNNEKCKNERMHEMNKNLVSQIAKLKTLLIQQSKRQMQQSQQSFILDDDRDILRNKIKQLQDQKIIIYEAYRELQNNFNQLNLELIQSEVILSNSQEKVNIENKGFQSINFLGDTINEIIDQKTQTKLYQKENRLLKFQQMLNASDCTIEQAKEILQSHFNNMPRFQTQQQRNLYQMATQMNTDLWRKRLEMEVRSLYQKKIQLKKLQCSLSKLQVK